MQPPVAGDMSLAMTTEQQAELLFALIGSGILLLGTLFIVGGFALRRRTSNVPGRLKGLWRLFVVGGGFVFLGSIFAFVGVMGLAH